MSGDSTMLDRVKEALAAITSKGAFATERACPSDDLDIEVKGVGALRFPISANMARALRAIAHSAPFGRRDKTMRDPSVRDTWEIGRSRIKIDARKWNRTLDPVLASFRGKLGLADDGKLVAVLDKMLVYTPGQFFASHQDSERADDMVGSLVVELPSASSGGAVVVRHHGEKKIFRGAKRGPKDLSLLAFYADCHHEVKPIASGYRIVLTYQLLYCAATSPRAPVPQSPSASAAVDGVAKSVKAYFSTPVARGYGNTDLQRPDRLIYLSRSRVHGEEPRLDAPQERRSATRRRAATGRRASHLRELPRPRRRARELDVRGRRLGLLRLAWKTSPPR